MDIFKLGDKILALLEIVFGFWNNQVSLVFAMLGQSPVHFKGGGPWGVIEAVNPVFVAVGSSLVVLFFVMGRPMPIHYIRYKSDLQVFFPNFFRNIHKKNSRIFSGCVIIFRCRQSPAFAGDSDKFPGRYPPG